MSNIYTKEIQAAQPISVLSSIDVERAKRRRETIAKRKNRRLASLEQKASAYREGTGVSGRIAGRHTHASERKVVRELRAHYRQTPLFNTLPIWEHKNSLKVLFISAADYAFMGYTLAECLKSIGIEAIAVSDRYSPLKPVSEQGRVCKAKELLRLVKETYAIVWMHSLYKEFPSEILKGKKCVAFHGGTRYRRKSKTINDLINPKVHMSLVQTGELLKRGAKNEHWFLPPIDTEGIKSDYTFSNKKKLVIGHFSSHPRNRFTKGTALIESVIDSLKKSEWGDHFIYEGGDKKAHIPLKANLDRMAKCDIYIESLSQIQPSNPNRHDWSIQALEACALGCITITNFFFEKQYKQEYGEHGLLVANAEKDVREILIRLFQMDREELLKLKQKARQWVETQHSYKVVGKKLESLLGLNEKAPSKIKSVKKGIISDLAACKAAFDKAQIPWVIIDGIVLGYVRHNDVIEWDTDVDLAIPYEVSKEGWQKLYAALKEKGLGIKNLQQDFIYGKRNVKLNAWMLHRKGDFYESFPRTTPGIKFVEKAEWYKNIMPVDFLGSVYPMPSNLEDYIVHRYGEDWREARYTHDEWRLEKFGTISSKFLPDVWLKSRCGPEGDLWPRVMKVEDTP